MLARPAQTSIPRLPRLARLPSLPLALLALVVIATPLAGSSCSSTTPPPAATCSSSPASEKEESLAAGDVGVYLDTSDPLLDPVASDLASYLTTTWGKTIAVKRAVPGFTEKRTLWLSTSDAAAAKAGVSLADGYAIKRVAGTGNSAAIIVYAKDAANLAFGAYALLEELGVRFFHPKDELVPRRGAPVLPLAIDVTRAPLVKQRGLQFHTLHPIEYFAVFNVPSAANLADAKRVIDWLVKTGQNFVQWALLSTVDPNWPSHAQAIVAYAHSRGVRVGAVVQLWKGAALQNNFDLVTDPMTWQTDMDAQLAALMQTPWDVVEIALGEFKATDPTSLVTWLTHATSQLATTNPSVEVNVQNHVGNYPQLWVPYNGQTYFYYQLPQFADPRLGMSVHTLFFFDLYRDWGMYAHPDFHLQHDFLLQEIPNRRVNYFPESAYWVTADISVPAFLPEYVVARLNDVQGLAGEIAAKGLPALNGHVMFTSGHEWGYWLTDYLTAKMLWDPKTTTDSLFADYASSYGSCAGGVASTLSQFTALQTKYLFNDRLAPYVMGEDTEVDLGAIAQIYTIPRRVQFEDVVAMEEPDRAAFEASVVTKLEALAAQVQPLEDAMAARCPTADAQLSPWCGELWDGIEIVRLRVQHSAALYRATLAYARGEASSAQKYFDQATATSATAATVIARREAHYRFDVGTLTNHYVNPTIYPYGYLRQAHTQCFFHRREDQVQAFLDGGAAAPILGLRSCDD
jgi:hypothetical protein